MGNRNAGKECQTRKTRKTGMQNRNLKQESGNSNAKPGKQNMIVNTGMQNRDPELESETRESKNRNPKTGMQNRETKENRNAKQGSEAGI